jgi:putative transposase
MTKFTQTYSTDLKYTEWQQIMDFFQALKEAGCPNWGKWQILNAIFYVNRIGCQWRNLPINFLLRQTVHFYYWSWKKAGLWERINQKLVQKVWKKAERNEQASAGVVDSRSVKTSEGEEERVVDVYKQTSGRKRHLIGGCLGLGFAGRGTQRQHSGWSWMPPDLAKIV